MAKTQKTTTKTAKAPVARATCGCGCGQTPAGRRSVYLPGHDTKHRSAFKAAHPRRKVRFVWSDEKRAKAAARLREYRAAKKAVAA